MTRSKLCLSALQTKEQALTLSIMCGTSTQIKLSVFVSRNCFLLLANYLDAVQFRLFDSRKVFRVLMYFGVNNCIVDFITTFHNNRRVNILSWSTTKTGYLLSGMLYNPLRRHNSSALLSVINSFKKISFQTKHALAYLKKFLVNESWIMHFCTYLFTFSVLASTNTPNSNLRNSFKANIIRRWFSALVSD